MSSRSLITRRENVTMKGIASTFRQELLHLLPAATYVVWSLYLNIIKYIFKTECHKISLGVGFGILALYSFFIPWIHHEKQSWRGYVFHAFVSCIAFSALVLPTQNISNCFFGWSNQLVEVTVPIGTWLIIGFIALIMHCTDPNPNDYTLVNN